MKFLTVSLTIITAFSMVSSNPCFAVDNYKNTLTLAASRILGGRNAQRHQFPYQVSLRWGWFGLKGHICGGSLIKENVVLTAAHCKASTFGDYDVVLGQLNQSETHGDVQVIEVAEFIAHEKYAGDWTVGPNDIAVLILQTSAQLSRAVQLVPLGKGRDCNALEGAILSGWGVIRWPETCHTTLQWVKLPRISNEQCALGLISILGNSEPLDETMICVGSPNIPFQGSCNGDSGGPLVLASNRKLIGVVSWGIAPCGADSRAPSVFTSVCSHREWIDRYM